MMESQWKKELAKSDVDAMALVGRLLEVSYLLDRYWLSPMAAEYNLQKGEFDVMATLRRAGEPYQLTPTVLHQSLLLTSGAMTSRLDRLEKANLILRQPSPTDRRSVQVQLTLAGLELINQILPLHIANEQEALSELSSDEQQQLGVLLDKLTLGLQKKRSTK
jgi:DNA-binding MarR family transcriptional regulator